jgi:hypothetical protein
MLGLGIYVGTTCIALAAVVVLMRGISALCFVVLGISAARLLVASKFALESCFGDGWRVLLAETSTFVERKTRNH